MFECDTGILFDTAMLADNGLDVHTLHPVYQRLPKPVVEPSPNMMEKYEVGQLVPIGRRSSHIQLIPDEKDLNVKRKKERSGIEFTAACPEDEYNNPKEDWVPEQVKDYFDAMAPLNDQLVDAKGWWVLELWPVKVKTQRNREDEWEKKISFNRGRYRPVQDLEPNVHWTVKQRMRDTDYKMRTAILHSNGVLDGTFRSQVSELSGKSQQIAKAGLLSISCVVGSFLACFTVGDELTIRSGWSYLPSKS